MTILFGCRGFWEEMVCGNAANHFLPKAKTTKTLSFRSPILLGREIFSKLTGN